MNPPSALHSAMGRDRKPFTYTPGGLDLSEIKSERMAKRLMRNAMNQGVPELPQHVLSPPATSTPIAVPNYNCLPVQVFPINLPANPKSLLRTRSVPGQPREPPVQREAPQRVPPQTQFVNNTLPRVALPYDTFNKNTPAYQTNNNRPASMYEYAPTDVHSHMNYGTGGHTVAFPEPQYDAQFYNVANVQPSISTNVYSFEPVQAKSDFNDMSFYNQSEFNNKNDEKVNLDVATDVSTPVEVALNEDQSSDEKKEVKVVSKQVKQESNIEEHNGDQNGEGDTETEMVVKLPTKKSAAKTETKVEVTKKILPDGTVEEVKKTTTKTTIDGKTETKTKTETRILPKEKAEEEEEEEEEVEEVEEDVEENEEVNNEETTKENGHDNIIKTEEKSETVTLSKKAVIVQESEEKPEEEDEEQEETVEEEVEVEPVTIVLKKPVETAPSPKEEEKETEEEEEVEEIEEQEVEVEKEVEKVEVKVEETVKTEDEEVVEEQIESKEQETVTESKEEIVENNTVPENDENTTEQTEKEEEQEIEAESQFTEAVAEEKTPESEPVETTQADEKSNEPEVNEDEKEEVVKESQEIVDTKQEMLVEKEEVKEQKTEVKEVILTPKLEDTEQKIPLREPSVPLDKVEDVEIKPIGAGDFIKKHTESTEIIRSTEKPLNIGMPPGGGIVTEYNRTENIVTVNRTIKTLDNTFDSISQSIPPVKSFFTPHVENIATSPQLSRPYQPVYPPEPTTERRHSLLLERLSVERQMPSDIYQNNYQYTNQSTEQRQMSQEPQAEVLTVSNVKPSMITNSQWYQQTKKEVVQNQSAPSWQTQPQPQIQRQLSPQPQQQSFYPPQTQYDPPAQPQYQYQPTYMENNQVNQQTNAQQMYSSYTTQPTNWSANNQLDTNTKLQSNQYSFKESSPSYQPMSQPVSSSYVPPPWEQDSTYAVDTSQNYFQPPPQSNDFSSAPNQGWKPTPPAGKFTKPAPKAYIPPKPNQSFVKPVINVEPPKTPGRKTYYSEYERRYISVPESTYIPAETKFQPQPDPSPQYYYDNNEPTEPVEPEWRKELREFTEKTQTQTSSVKPPWEMESKYVKPEPAHTPTPTWSQTLRPQSWRERSFESEYVGQTNTLGRARPLSSISKESIPERTRGVSVDRYNPNSYQPPVAAEHPPVQTYTHNPPAPHASGYHNPNVPAYHARASAEPREQPIPQARVWRDLRASPFQSRSFKYLQWITGTED